MVFFREILVMTRSQVRVWHGIGMVLWCRSTYIAMERLCFGGLPRWMPVFIRNVSFVKEWKE